MAILYDLPDIDSLNSNKKIEVLAAPPGLHDTEVDSSWSMIDFLMKGFYTAKVGIAPTRTQNF